MIGVQSVKLFVRAHRSGIHLHLSDRESLPDFLLLLQAENQLRLREGQDQDQVSLFGLRGLFHRLCS